MVKKFAFTLIELIFAIVIIGITVISLPMMNQAISKGMENSLTQEAIFASTTKLNEIISYPWDENSTETNSTFSRVIWTSVNDCNNSTKLRPGHIMEPQHRRCLDSNFSLVQPTTALGMETNDANIYDDIDDFNNVSTNLFIVNGTGSIASAEGYKDDNYSMNIDVTYTAFGTVSATSQNIKKIEITIKDLKDNSIITKLHTYSANIGEIDYYKRSY